MAREHHYSEFAHLLDVDAFEEAIEFQFIDDDGKGNDVGYCPDPWGLHKNGDSTGKFAIHREKKVYNCWVCGGGTLLSLAMAVWDLSEDEAINKLATFCGEPTDERFEDEISDLLKDEREREPVTPWFNERVLDQFMVPAPELAYFCHDRHISTEVCETHKLGFNPSAQKISKKGTYEGPGIIFPHFWQGRLVGWQTRWLEPDDVRPPWVQKYNNTRDFPKRWTIYNYERVYLSPDPIVVVESVPTALFLESRGYPAVAMFGATVPSEQLRLLRACQQGLILAPDNDEPGIGLIQKAVGYLEPFVDLKVCPPVGDDNSGDDLADHPDEADEAISEALEIGLL